MKPSTFPCPCQKETVYGFLYLAFQMVFLPSFLIGMNSQLSAPLNSAALNFVYYLLNFLAVLVIFRDFLNNSLKQALQNPGLLFRGAVLGFAAYWVSFSAIDRLIQWLYPLFSNYNDEAIFAMRGSSRLLMTVGTVILVPPAEECFYRGLIFRNLYCRSRWAAYLVSTLAFACIHILGYLGVYSPLELSLALLQYLPAGLFLAWSFEKSRTIFAPIIIHAAVNFITISGLR